MPLPARSNMEANLTNTATLKLAIVPEETSVAVVSFPTMRDAASAAAGIMQAGIPVASMEVMTMCR